MNTLYYGDNLEILRERIAPESVDLIYLDPPFNSNRSYNVLFGQKHVADDRAQIEAFDDTWTWNQETERLYFDLINGGAPNKVADAIQAMHGLLGENDVLAYLVMMAVRLVELRRVLKSTGSLYLHCDPTASHYLKVLMDAVFGPEKFRSEVIWERSGSHNSAKRWGPLHDTILMYTQSSTYTWNPVFQPYDPAYIQSHFTSEDDRGRFQPVSLTGPGTRTGESGQPWRGFDPTAGGRHWQPPAMMYNHYEELTGERLVGLPMAERLDRADAASLIYWPKKVDGIPRFKQYESRSPGQPLQDVWTDIDAINSQAQERLGFQTQKPIALLERIVTASSNPGDVVLDPFCGCGTTVIAAEKLGRRWIGIDVTYIAIDLMRRRLEDVFLGEAKFEMDGIPRDMPGAKALFERSPFEFERWAVSLVYGEPNEKQVGDRGTDGVIRFPLSEKNKVGRVLASVKGGTHVGPTMVRDLGGTVDAEKAQMGVLIAMTKPTAKMTGAAHHTGSYTWPVDGRDYPKVQIVTIAELLDGLRLTMPPPLSPYTQAARHTPQMDQLRLG